MRVSVISESGAGLRVCAASARISTTEGSALEIFGKTDGGERDQRLVRKVLASGHKSLIEHHTFTVAFNDVPVYVEQFMIEFRLASFTVKSRRYVDFGHAGYDLPTGLEGAARDRYAHAVEARFADYNALIARGVPKEDARFVLPYAFYSNFYLTCDARELLHIIEAALYGRGAALPAVREIGEALAAQFEARYPGVIEQEKSRAEAAAPAPELVFGDPTVAVPQVALIGEPADAPDALSRALAFTRRFSPDDLPALLRDARPRELECLYYTFNLSDVSLACMTHFARHRMQSPLFAPVLDGLIGGRFILPETVARDPEAENIYRAAFADEVEAARSLAAIGMPDFAFTPLTLSGHTVPLQCSMNARSLLHFGALRACNRAQWEIRALCGEMLGALRQSYPALFAHYGPSCAVTGRCPEGKLSCGHPPKQG